jgi:ClpP class serine protease
MLEDRLKFYVDLEKLRGRPLIVYVTSARAGMPGLMGADAIPEFLDQLELLSSDTKAVDLLVVSNGGDPIVAWRVITLLRERVEKIGVLVPQAAYSAATLLAMGADEIVMHPNGNLGPVDPQILVKRSGEAEPQRFGFEEMTSFLQFAKDKVGITDQRYLHAIFDH